jgi:hypothetical protein
MLGIKYAYLMINKNLTMIFLNFWIFKKLNIRKIDYEEEIDEKSFRIRKNKEKFETRN